jgi:hypothetical protein
MTIEHMLTIAVVGLLVGGSAKCDSVYHHLLPAAGLPISLYSCARLISS